MEMLIVVAIIAILVAVSIPIFMNQLEKSREATDEANFRAAKAEIVAMYLSDEFGTNNVADTAYYNAAQGVFQDDVIPAADGYGKGTVAGTDKAAYTNAFIRAQYQTTNNGQIVLDWVIGDTPAVLNPPGMNQTIPVGDS